MVGVLSVCVGVCCPERADEGRRADADVGAMPMPMLMDGLAVGVSGIGKSMYMVVVWDCE
jgi:hypothetical protein